MAGHLVKIEIEVDTLDQLAEVLEVGLADVALLDNMDPATMKKAVAMTAGRLVLEASGGITHETAAAVAATGVDYLSSGAITHSSTNLDVGSRYRYLELLRRFRGRDRVAPHRRIGAVAPGARPIECVHAKLVQLHHFAHPARAHPVGVVMRRLANLA